MVWNKIRDWLHRSPHVHIRVQGINSLRDVVDLIDRFIDGDMAYELEWDDFISWTHEYPSIETVRVRIGATEPLLFSKDPTDRVRAIEMLVEERNRIAALIGLPPRRK